MKSGAEGADDHLGGAMVQTEQEVAEPPDERWPFPDPPRRANSRNNIFAFPVKSRAQGGRKDHPCAVPRAPFTNSALLRGGGGCRGGPIPPPHPPTLDPPPQPPHTHPLKRLGQIFFQAYGLRPVCLHQNLSSAALIAQHHPGGGGGGLARLNPPPPTP